MSVQWLYRNLKLIILTNLLMGCASQLTPQGEAEAQQSNEIEENNLSSQQALAEAIPFVSERQEYFYKTLVAEVAAQRGYLELSVPYSLEVAQYTRNLRAAERAVHIALFAKKYDFATEAATLWMSLEPKSVEARQILTELLLNQNRLAEASAHLEKILTEADKETEQLEEVIFTLLEQQKDKKATLSFMKELATKRPKVPTILLIYARLLINEDNMAEALIVLRKLLTVMPDHPQATPLYVQVLRRLGKTDQALQWMEKAVKTYPEMENWKFIYGQILAEDEQYDKAAEQLKQLLEKNSQRGDILYTLGTISLKINKVADAKSYFSALLKTSEQADTARFYLAYIAELENNEEEAIKWYKQVKKGTFYFSAQARIAEILAKQGNPEEALAHLRSLSAESKEDTEALTQLEAEILTEQGKHQEAMEVYNQALEEEADNINLLYMRAMLAEKMGDIAQMEKDLKRILEIEPDNANAMNALGYSLTNNTTRYQEAYALIEKALSLQPDTFYILDSMGWVLYRLGRHKDAIHYLNQAIAKQNDPEVAAHLGEVLWITGEQEKAKAVWEKGLEDFPNDERLIEVKKRFLR